MGRRRQGQPRVFRIILKDGNVEEIYDLDDSGRLKDKSLAQNEQPDQNLPQVTFPTPTVPSKIKSLAQLNNQIQPNVTFVSKEPIKLEPKSNEPSNQILPKEQTMKVKSNLPQPIISTPDQLTLVQPPVQQITYVQPNPVHNSHPNFTSNLQNQIVSPLIQIPKLNVQKHPNVKPFAFDPNFVQFLQLKSAANDKFHTYCQNNIVFDYPNSPKLPLFNHI